MRFLSVLREISKKITESALFIISSYIGDIYVTMFRKSKISNTTMSRHFLSFKGDFLNIFFSTTIVRSTACCNGMDGVLFSITSFKLVGYSSTSTPGI